MKKIITLLFASMMLLSLVACGGYKSSSPSDNSSSPVTQQTGNNKISESGRGETQAEKFENKIVLSVDKTHYDQAERIAVTMNFADVDKDNAIIAIVNSELPHGQTTPAEENTEEYRWIADFSEIPFYLWTPEKDGVFDVRVYTSSSGEELASITIAVGNAALPSGSGSSDNAGTGNTPDDSGKGGVLTESGECTQKQMEDTIVSYLSKISSISSLTLGGGSRIQYDKAGDVLNDFDIWTIYSPTLDNNGMYESMNSQITAAGFTYEKDMVGRHVWYIDDGGEHKGILFWPDDDESPDGYYILMMTYAAN